MLCFLLITDYILFVVSSCMMLGINDLSFIVSNKGKPLLVLNDCIYRLKKQTLIKKYWICQENGCTAYVHTDNDNVFIISTGNHNHLCKPETVRVKQFRNNLKDRAVKETTAISKIYEEEIIKSRLSTGSLATLPLVREIRMYIEPLYSACFPWHEKCMKYLESGLLYTRRKLTPVLPSSSFFDIPDSYQVTLRNEIFLFSDTLVCRRKRMLLFSSITQLEMLFDSATILMDGTFSCTPPFFDQVFTIHALKFETSNIWFPCLIYLLHYFHEQVFHVCLVFFQIERKPLISNCSKS